MLFALGNLVEYDCPPIQSQRTPRAEKIFSRYSSRCTRIVFTPSRDNSQAASVHRPRSIGQALGIQVPLPGKVRRAELTLELSARPRLPVKRARQCSGAMRWMACANVLLADGIARLANGAVSRDSHAGRLSEPAVCSASRAERLANRIVGLASRADRSSDEIVC